MMNSFSYIYYVHKTVSRVIILQVMSTWILFTVIVELKSFRTGNFFNEYDCINTITPGERNYWIDTLTNTKHSYAFIFCYFYEDNTFYMARLTLENINEMNFEEWKNRYCFKKSHFHQVHLRRDYRLFH